MAPGRTSLARPPRIRARDDDESTDSMRDYQVKPLDSDTWGRVHAARGGAQWCVRCCWCTGFHTFPADKTYNTDANRALKQRLVDEGGPHAALVFDGDEAVAWCEYGRRCSTRHPHPLRAGRLHLRVSQGDEELCDAQGGALTDSRVIEPPGDRL